MGKHGQKHLAKLAECWHESDLSLKQKEFISERLKDLLALESRIIKQAHERIIGGRKVKNKDKILSIYDLDIEVLKRGKAGKEVEDPYLLQRLLLQLRLQHILACLFLLFYVLHS